ncbi:methyltransferase of UbiE/COQ5 family [Microcystis sp. 0824]|jgi:tRNA (cmo5U34)-methyltransferase|uniref:Carboxy-S-adenosyl-L-methionine synthase n=7 Tax=Microcystis TaxID=1125 RepID=A0A5A5RQJ8_MICAE|nr:MULTISPECIES: class I SAM-dependent methyltransferase [Microcystis]MCE2661457.1 class I SAM-dependent methyltransferase [Microcystis sp. 53602_E8]MCZ8362355.1 class I SAM-dependent methyltransferase [Microcystis sp. LE19-251.1A]MDJ0525981.1 class I SAM-dependent methyltransferase [Microcystis sp. M53600_WE12]NCR76740.1 class I SAM-dependent methyltransferase [Microcystis aeruginosa K13-06]TRU26627.1 MAG: class I SAM-dependent methyltransferase [Microcystis aeruginosa Ma_MB_S_20031200_S102D]
MENNQLIERRFDGKIGDDYSLWQSARPHLKKLRQELVKLLINYQNSCPKESLILEIGCGDGELTEMILSEAKNIKIIAIDNEPSMIQKIRSRLSHYLSQDTLVVIQDDVLNFLQSYPLNNFNFIVSGFTFHNMLALYRFQVFQLLYSRLLIGGKLLDADKIAQRGEQHNRDIKWQYDKFFEVLVSAERFDLLKEVMLHYTTDEQPNRIRYEDETISELSEIGFQEVTLYLRQYMDALIIASK